MVLLAMVLVAVVLAACSGPSAPKVSATTLLRQARNVVDHTGSAHFVLTSTGAAGRSPLITGGVGDLARPDSFRGTLTVLQDGLTVHVKVISVNGALYVEAPFTTHFAKVNPSSYGFGDPGRLLRPGTGLSSLLTRATSARLAAQDRFQGQVLDEVDVVLPGAAVAGLLPDAAPAQPVHGVIGIVPGDHHVRRVVLSGPFYRAGHTSSFTVVVDHYGESVAIVPPPG